jgi:hypothetical protein
MIVGVKHVAKKDASVSLKKITALKKLFGIRDFYLENLFGKEVSL